MHEPYIAYLLVTNMLDATINLIFPSAHHYPFPSYAIIGSLQQMWWFRKYPNQDLLFATNFTIMVMYVHRATRITAVSSHKV